MKKINFKNKKIGIWGFGIVGQSALKYISKFTDQIQLMDQRPSNTSIIQQNPKNITRFLQENDLIIASPGIVLHDYQHYAYKFVSELDIFAQEFYGHTIAITGTVGKTSITSLLAQCTPNSLAAGNIGNAMLHVLDLQPQPSQVILELSSYQLSGSKTFAPDLAILTNFYPNHLDHHKDAEEYFAAKCNLLKNQNAQQIALLPYDLIDKIKQFVTPQAQIYLFQENYNNWILDRSRGRRVENHTQSSTNINSDSNIAVSQNNIQDSICSSSVVLGADRGSSQKIMNYPIFYLHNNQLLLHQNDKTQLIFENFKQLPDITFTENWIIILAALHLQNISLKNFAIFTQTLQPVEHRLEFVKTLNGVQIYNDSKSTVWQATKLAVEKFSGKKIALFLGGISKGTDRTPLIQYLQNKKVMMFAFGKEAEMLANLCRKFKILCMSAPTLQESLHQYLPQQHNFDILLFSPAGASFDLFKNFEDRGVQFKKMIEGL